MNPIAWVIAKIGVKAARILGAILLGLLVWGGIKLAFWAQGFMLDRARSQRDAARVQAAVEAADAAQAHRSALETVKVVSKQDASLAKNREATRAALEVVDERIAATPAGGPAPRVDPVVLRELEAARARAQAAARRLSGPEAGGPRAAAAEDGR